MMIWMVCGVFGSSHAWAQDVLVDPTVPPPVAQKHPLRDGLGWRLGFISTGLFESGQGRPFFYLDTGLRFKSDRIYFDLKFPAFIGGLDFLFLQFQKFLGANDPFNLFEFFNEPIHYGAHMEFSNVRLGQTFTLFPLGDDAPLRTTLGVFVLADWVFFDLVLIQNRDPEEEFDPKENPNVNDPIVVAPGGFVAFGGDAPITAYDIALGAGPDIYVDDAYAPNNGWVLFVDLDLHIDVLEDLAVHYRTRVSTYTHTEKPVVTMDVNFGVVLRLW